MAKTMDEYKHHQLKSGGSGRAVKNPKQAIAIGLSEARRSGADIPEAPSKGRKATKGRKASKKSARKGAAKSSSKRR
jgi:hypothetical protein